MSWAFLGAPAPARPCAGGASGPPDTGQNVCYRLDQVGQRWVAVPCDEAACQGQDGQYATGCRVDGPNGSGRFSDNGDGTVTDNCTGLMWQKDTADVNGDGQSTHQDLHDWCGALAHCENLELAGYDDWRLPNVSELQSIVDYGRPAPTIDPVFGALSSFYWSSTSYAGNPDRAWIVLFDVGHCGTHVKYYGIYVRAVRSGP